MPHVRQSLRRWTGTGPVTCGNRSSSETERSTALDRTFADGEATARSDWENGPGTVQSSASPLRTFETTSEHAYCIPHEAAGMEGFAVEG